MLVKLQLYLKQGFHHKTVSNTFSFPYNAISQLNRLKFQYSQSTGVFCYVTYLAKSETSLSLSDKDFLASDKWEIWNKWFEEESNLERT